MGQVSGRGSQLNLLRDADRRPENAGLRVGMPNGWVDCSVAGAGGGPVASALAAIGLAARCEASLGPGVLVVGGDLDAACDQLMRVSRGGESWVLAVVVDGAQLDGGASWRLLEAGAADVLAWRDAGASVGQIQARIARAGEIELLMGSPIVKDNLVGGSRAWRDALRQIVEVGRYTGASLLLEGESGTGKELAARLVHALDQRPGKRDLVVLDCSAIVPTLSGSEFFGHERGAFTGASAARDGAFALASGGTLFLDEVGELDLPMQAQLLRVVQERVFKRVGGNSWFETDFRLVCATNRDLRAEVAAGRFRGDLYHRIATWVCRLPPLRDRREDILPLAHHFLAARAQPEPEPEMDDAVREFLVHRDYPGNVRELRQVVTRIAERHVGVGPITPGDVPISDRPRSAERPLRGATMDDAVRRAVAMGVRLRDIGRDATDAAIRMVVEEEGGNLQRAARRLGVTDRALQLRRRSADTGGDDTAA